MAKARLMNTPEDYQKLGEVPDEYEDAASEKIYPKAIHYVFENGTKRADYTLQMKDIIEYNGKNNLPAAKRFITKAAGIDPAYTRYTAIGSLILSYGTKNMERSGELIYEFMYPGSSFKGHM